MFKHALDETNRATDIVLIVSHRLADTFTNCLEASKVNNRLDRTVSCEHIIQTVLIADIKLLKDDHLIDLSGNLLHACKADCAAIAKIVDDYDLGEAAVAICFQDLDHCVRADVASATGDKERRLRLCCFRHLRFFSCQK